MTLTFVTLVETFNIYSKVVRCRNQFNHLNTHVAMNELLEMNLSGGTHPVRLVDLQDFHRDTSPGSIQAMRLAIKRCCLIFENTKHHPRYVSVDLFSDISLIRCEYWNLKKNYKIVICFRVDFSIDIFFFLTLDWHRCHFVRWDINVVILCFSQ